MNKLFVIYKNNLVAPQKELQTLKYFMIIDTCEIIDFLSGEKINKTLYLYIIHIIYNNTTRSCDIWLFCIHG